MLDTAEIKVKAGNGGNGLVSFRREKYVPRGGPWGGDGGKGGNLYFKVDAHFNTLTLFKRKSEYKAQNGGPGMKNNKQGKDGEDLYIPVPPGTVVKDENNEVVFDLVNDGEIVLIDAGGRGGLGNWHFKSSVNRTPMKATPGVIREQRKLKLELKLIADIGIIGLPSSGKSTLLNALTHTNVKTAEYHFTTLEPNLGVLHVEEYIPNLKQDIVIADIPGLIENASQGKGLGHDFLRHIERTNILIHVVDGSTILNYPIDQLKKDYDVIRNELKEWNKTLLKKREIIVINKLDVINDEATIKEITKIFKNKAIILSAASRTNLNELVKEIVKLSNEIVESPSLDNQKEEGIQPSSLSFNINNLPNRRIIFK